MIYEFDATNWKAQSTKRNTVIVSLHSQQQALKAWYALTDLGFECTEIRDIGETAFETADEAVEWTKRLLR